MYNEIQSFEKMDHEVENILVSMKENDAKFPSNIHFLKLVSVSAVLNLLVNIEYLHIN